MRFCISLTILSFASSIGYASSLPLSEIISSMKKHHPKILEEVQRVSESKQLIREARGAFDLKISSDVLERTQGYYDGSYQDITVEKGLQAFNSKVYIGHKNSTGQLPIYDQEFQTLDEGESRIGISFSLLRDRSIDKKRLFLWNAKESYNQSKSSQDMLLYLMEMDAKITYFNWVAKGLVLNVYEELLDVAVKRTSGLEKRVKKGDLAKIYLAENEQYLMRWRTKKERAYQDFFKSSLELSLYYRDLKGEPLLPVTNQLPRELMNSFKDKVRDVNIDIRQAIIKSPDLNIIESKLIQIANEKEYGVNQYLPKLDVKFESAKDQGRGTESLEGQDNKIYLSLEIPIEQNLGRGKAEKAKAKMLALKRKKQFLSEKITTKLKTLFNQVSVQKKIIKNTSRESELALKLEAAEARKFNNGDSDFFIVNLREQNRANAQIDLIKSKFDLLETNALYEAVSNGLLL